MGDITVMGGGEDCAVGVGEGAVSVAVTFEEHATFSIHTPPYGCCVAFSVIFLILAWAADMLKVEGVYAPLVTPVNVLVALPSRVSAPSKASMTTIEDWLLTLDSDEGVDATVMVTVPAVLLSNARVTISLSLIP